MNINIAKRDENFRHKNELKNLRDSHTNEIESQKLAHQKRKQQVKSSAQMELGSLRLENQQRLTQEAQRKEKTLSQVQESLQNVKERTQLEEQRIKDMFSERSQREKKLFEVDIQARKKNNELIIQDVEHEKTMELQRLRREAQQVKNDTAKSLNSENAQIKDQLQNKIVTDKSQFDKQIYSQEIKFHNALTKKIKENKKVLVDSERKHQAQVELRDKTYLNESTKKSELNQKSLTLQQKNFEEKFQENYKNNERLLQKLAKQKESILERLKKSVKEDLIYENKIDKDVFYKNVSYEPVIKMNDTSDRYILELKVSEHEAKNFQVTAYDREIKLTMNRDYNFKSEGERSKSSINRAETFTQKFAVDEILDGKKMVKSYNDGVLKFEIGLA